MAATTAQRPKVGNNIGKQTPPPAAPKKKLLNYGSVSTGSTTTEIGRVIAGDLKTVGITISKVRFTKPNEEEGSGNKPYVFLSVPDTFISKYELDEEGVNSLLIYFSGGAKAILEETGNRVSASRMELVEAENEDGVFFLFTAKGEELGSGEGEMAA